MPAFCTHYLFSNQLFPWIKDRADSIENVVNLGSQGPDIFFFKRVLPVFMPGKMGMKTGSSLHKQQAEKIFKAFADYLKENDNQIARSYVYGFILHYALDRNCHPYVYAKQNEMTDSNRFIHHNSAHNKIEMALDSFMMHQKKNIDNVKTFDTAKTIELSDEEKLEVGKLLSFVIKEVLDEDISVEDVRYAIDDTVKFQNVLRDKSGVLKNVLVVLETIVAPIVRYIKLSSYFRPKEWKKGIEYANIDNDAWTSPYSNEKSTLSFEELFEIAIADAKVLIDNFDKYMAGECDSFNTNNISFLTGLEVL